MRLATSPYSHDEAESVSVERFETRRRLSGAFGANVAALAHSCAGANYISRPSVPIRAGDMNVTGIPNGPTHVGKEASLRK
jgi:hypothetical protein